MKLEATANYLSGSVRDRLETQDGLAAQVAAVRLMGLPLAYLENYTTAGARGHERRDSAPPRPGTSIPSGPRWWVVGGRLEDRRPLESIGKVTGRGSQNEAD